MPELDAIALLRNDHDSVRRVLEDLAGAQEPDERRALFGQVRRELLVHAMIEQELVYPAYVAAADPARPLDSFLEAEQERHVVEVMLGEFDALDPRRDAFRAKTHVLQDMVERHAMEEEQEIFPVIQEALDEATMAQLGQHLALRRGELLAAADKVFAGGHREPQPPRPLRRPGKGPTGLPSARRNRFPTRRARAR